MIEFIELLFFIIMYIDYPIAFSMKKFCKSKKEKRKNAIWLFWNGGKKKKNKEDGKERKQSNFITSDSIVRCERWEQCICELWTALTALTARSHVDPYIYKIVMQ